MRCYKPFLGEAYFGTVEFERSLTVAGAIIRLGHVCGNVEGRIVHIHDDQTISVDLPWGRLQLSLEVYRNLFGMRYTKRVHLAYTPLLLLPDNELKKLSDVSVEELLLGVQEFKRQITIDLEMFEKMIA